MSAQIIPFPKAAKPRKQSRRMERLIAEAGDRMAARIEELTAQPPGSDPLLDEARRVFRSLPKAQPETLSAGEVAQVRQMLREHEHVCAGCPIASRLLVELD